jgi:hypothetical protein
MHFGCYQDGLFVCVHMASATDVRCCHQTRLARSRWGQRRNKCGDWWVVTTYTEQPRVSNGTSFAVSKQQKTDRRRSDLTADRAYRGVPTHPTTVRARTDGRTTSPGIRIGRPRIAPAPVVRGQAHVLGVMARGPRSPQNIFAATCPIRRPRKR